MTKYLKSQNVYGPKDKFTELNTESQNGQGWKGAGSQDSEHIAQNSPGGVGC